MKTDRKPRRVALFAGVDEYPEDSNIPKLTCAVKDARALREFFEGCQGQFDRITGLDNPTSNQLGDAIDDLTADLGAGDLFLLYFAGHGTVDKGGQQLLCSDSRVRRGMVRGALPSDYVTQSGARHNTAVVLDACRTPLESTRGGERTMDGRDLAALNSLVDAREREAGSLTVLCSCDEKMSAGELPLRGHGLFTMALLEVLRNAGARHRRVDFDQNLSNAVGEVMKRIAREECRRENQRPWFKNSGTAPIFLLPMFDTQPLRQWVEGLLRAGLITEKEEADCLGAIAGNTDEPGGRGLFEVARFFSNWEEEIRNGDGFMEFASGMIKTFCEIGDKAKAPVAAPTPLPMLSDSQPDAGRERPGQAEATRPLVREERDALRRFCTSVSGGRWEDLEEVRMARTEEAAVKALDTVTLGWVETYGRGNALGRGVSRPLCVRVSPDGQALATEIRHVGESLRTPVQSAMLRALNAALSLGGRI